MVQFRFTLLRVIADVVFTVLLFFGFMCGVHYGTQLIGLYFVFVKFTLGVVGAGLLTLALRWIKYAVLFVLKNGSIYALCTEEESVLASIDGVMHSLPNTVSVTVLNKLIRDSLKQVKESVLASQEDGLFTEIADIFSNSMLARFSTAVMGKAFDYVDECILGYCYKHAGEEKHIALCGVEGFVIFVSGSVGIFKKVLSLLSVQMLLRGGYWVVYVLFCFKIFKFSAMNLLLCYVIGKCISFILEDAIYEPMLMRSIIQHFINQDFEDSLSQKMEELLAAFPPLAKLYSYAGVKQVMSEGATEDTGCAQE